MKKINKKGSHVSMVLSFILFVVALVFIYIIASSAVVRPDPVKNEISNLGDNVLNKITSEVFVFRVYRSDAGASCFSFAEPVNTFSNPETVALNNSGPVASSISGNDVLVDAGTGFVKVYFSDLIKNQVNLTTTGCSAVIPDSIRKESVILESQILSLMSNLSSNYSQTKEELEIPTSMDFDLMFEYKNGTTLDFLSSKEPNTEIYAKELNLFFLSNSGVEDSGKLIIKLW